MFSSLTSKLINVFSNIRKRGILTEDIVASTIREIRVSLLEADVALQVVRQITSNLKEKLIGQKVINSVSPEQTIIKAVYDELVKLLGDESKVSLKKGSILMAGLQGTGKTTTSAKLAKLLSKSHKVLLVSLDTYRPAAIEQLQKIAEANNLDFFKDFDSKDKPVEIAKKSMAIQRNYEYVIYDTAGRLSIDEEMLNEIKEIHQIVLPSETLLVIDSMMGQDAINTAKTFNDLLTLTGLILTRVDGDSRGGAALSAKTVTNCQIKYMTTGEKINDIEQFHPDRIASRILDQGDVITLVEKAIEANENMSATDIPNAKNFDLNSMEKYLRQMQKIGGLSGILKFIPGLGQIKNKLKEANINDKTISRQIAIIQSMTKQERNNPSILNASRRRRIAKGCAQEVSDVNKLIKQYETCKTMFSRIANFK